MAVVHFSNTLNLSITKFVFLQSQTEYTFQNLDINTDYFFKVCKEALIFTANVAGSNFRRYF